MNEDTLGVTTKGLMFRRQTSDEPGLERLYLRVFINDVVGDPAEDGLGRGAGGSDEDVIAVAGDAGGTCHAVHGGLCVGERGGLFHEAEVLERERRLNVLEQIGKSECGDILSRGRSDGWSWHGWRGWGVEDFIGEIFLDLAQVNDVSNDAAAFIVGKKRKAIAGRVLQVVTYLLQRNLRVLLALKIGWQGDHLAGTDHEILHGQGGELSSVADGFREIGDALVGGGKTFLLEIMRQHGADPRAQKRQDRAEDELGGLERFIGIEGPTTADFDDLPSDCENTEESEGHNHVSEHVGKVVEQIK